MIVLEQRMSAQKYNNMNSLTKANNVSKSSIASQYEDDLLQNIDERISSPPLVASENKSN